MELRWKKTNAEKAMRTLARAIGSRFDVPAPTPAYAAGRTGRNWQIRTETVKVWTAAGRAELNVDCSATFAHLYFRFDDPGRAVMELGRGDLDLNHFSGKWNSHASPRYDADLSGFLKAVALKMDRVARSGPTPEDVAAAEAEDARARELESAFRESVEAKREEDASPSP